MATTDTISAPALQWTNRTTRLVVAVVLAALIGLAATQLFGVGSRTAAEPAFRSVDYALRHPEAVVDMSSSRVAPTNDYGIRHLRPADG